MRGSSTPKRGKSTSDNRNPIRSPVRPDELASVTAGYRLWLAKQPLSMNTRRTHLGRVRQYCAYLETGANDYGDPHARDYAIRDFKTHLKKARKAKPASVNLMLAALDHLYLFLGLGRPKVRREDLPQEAPKASAWHTHPLGQTLIVTSGIGRLQRESGPIEGNSPRDIIWFAPGEKHWHGVSPTTSMTHIAIAESLDGKVVEWMNKVSDEQYEPKT